MIKQSTIDKIMDTVLIEEVIGDFVNLKRAGSNFKGLSPFVSEKTPSFFVSPAKQIFKDFSSGKGGNAISFLMEHEHLSYPEALKYLAEKYNIEVEEEGVTEEALEERSERESLHIVNQYAEQFFDEILWTSDEGKSIGLSYFRERGFSNEIIKKFKLGYSPDAWSAFYDSAIDKGYKEEYLLQAGLIKKASSGKLYDGYKGRVIFPIRNLSGRPIGFGGRTLKSDKNIPKYVNSPENPVYHKSNVLYGLYESKGAIVKADNCYLVEGYTDVIQFHLSGIGNTVASSGTSLTEGQIRLIKRYTENVTILYDGDPAGIKASFRGIDMLLAEGLKVRVVLFPDGEDPDSFAKSVSTEELQSFLEAESKDFMRFKTDILIADTQGDPIKKADLIHQLVNSIAVIPDHIARSIYLKECSRQLDIPEQALIDELNKERRKQFQANQKRSSVQTRNDSGPPPPMTEPPGVESQEGNELLPDIQPAITSGVLYHQELDLVRLLLNYGEDTIVVEAISESGETEEIETPVSHFLLNEIVQDDITFEHPIFQSIVSSYLKAVLETGECDSKTFVNHADADIRKVAADLLAKPHSLHKWAEKKVYVTLEEEKLQTAVKGALYAYRTRYIGKMISENRLDIESKYQAGKDVSGNLQRQIVLDEVKTQLAKAQGITILF